MLCVANVASPAKIYDKHLEILNSSNPVLNLQTVCAGKKDLRSSYTSLEALGCKFEKDPEVFLGEIKMLEQVSNVQRDSVRSWTLWFLATSRNGTQLRPS
jgi:hypothetical protein